MFEGEEELEGALIQESDELRVLLVIDELEGFLFSQTLEIKMTKEKDNSKKERKRRKGEKG